MKNKKICTMLICIVCILRALHADPEPVELVSDPLKLVIYPKTGNFCLYRIDASQESFYTPLYDDRTQSSLNVYSLLFNGHIYHLNNKSGKKIIIEQQKNSITVTFQISLDFIAVQHFSFEKNNGLTTGPLLKIVTEVQNISGAVADIALKAVFDTSFKDKARIPFYTDIRSEVSSELLLQPALEKDTVIFAADKGNSTMFFLKEKNQTTPASVFIANWERLITKTWLPTYVQGRSFKKSRTANPGILYVWSERKVANKQFFSISNCIGFYDYRAYHVQTAAPTVRTSRVHKTDTDSDVKQEPVSALENTVSDTAPQLPDTAIPDEEPLPPEAETQTPPEEDSYPQDTAAMTEQDVQKNYEKIEKLLNQIKQLEQNSSDISQYEIYQLQQEVDTIIKTLQEE
ncbi:MAG: hypothetical protein ACTTH8_01750 [Treponema sp.]